MRVIPGSHKMPQFPHRDTFAPNNLLSRGQEITVEVDERAGARPAIEARRDVAAPCPADARLRSQSLGPAPHRLRHPLSADLCAAGRRQRAIPRRWCAASTSITISGPSSGPITIARPRRSRITPRSPARSTRCCCATPPPCDPNSVGGSRRHFATGGATAGAAKEGTSMLTPCPLVHGLPGVPRGHHQLPRPRGAVGRGAAPDQGSRPRSGAARHRLQQLLRRLRAVLLRRRLGLRPLRAEARLPRRDDRMVDLLRPHRGGLQLRLPARHTRPSSAWARGPTARPSTSWSANGFRGASRRPPSASPMPARRSAAPSPGRSSASSRWRRAGASPSSPSPRISLVWVIAWGSWHRPAGQHRRSAREELDEIEGDQGSPCGGRHICRSGPFCAPGGARHRLRLLRLRLHPLFLPVLVPELSDHGAASQRAEHERRQRHPLAAGLHRPGRRRLRLRRCLPPAPATRCSRASWCWSSAC